MSADLAPRFRQRVGEFFRRALIKAEDLKNGDVADPRHRDRRQHDERALQFEVARDAAAARHPDREAAADWPAQLLDDIALRQA